MDIDVSRRASAAAALLGLVAALALPGSASAVANGVDVPEGRYRFAVKLTMTGIPTADGGRRNSGCSGALIARRWIITAGHCFRDANGVRVERPVADLTTATLGRANLTTGPGEVRTIIAVRQAPDRDIAIAQLNRPVSHRIRPLRLTTRPPVTGEPLRLTGWGADNSTNPVPSQQLRTGKVTVTSFTPETVGVRGLSPAPDTSACPYDSGAPYFREPRHGPPLLISVESNGPSCPHPLEETTARVDTLVTWIRSIV